jgi:hypothetical protein
MAVESGNQQFTATSFLDGANAQYIEQLYARYQDDPNSVTPESVLRSAGRCAGRCSQGRQGRLVAEEELAGAGQWRTGQRA